MSELITPTVTERSTYKETTINKYTFSDGTIATDVTIFPGDKPLTVLENPDGSIVEDHQAERYPYSERLLRTAVQCFDETGVLVLPTK